MVLSLRDFRPSGGGPSSRPEVVGPAGSPLRGKGHAPLSDEFVRKLRKGRWFDNPLARRSVVNTRARRTLKLPKGAALVFAPEGRAPEGGVATRQEPTPSAGPSLRPEGAPPFGGVASRQASFRPEGGPPFGGVASRQEVFRPRDDQAGLSAAYASGDNVVVRGDTLYISGTKHADSLLDIALNGREGFFTHLMKGDLQDVWDDLKIPFGATAKSQRFKEAEAALQANPQVTRLVGHSLGGASALELAKRYPDRDLKTVTYGAPVASVSGGERYRHPGDPISMLDLGAKNMPNAANNNPHSFEGFDAR